MKWPRKPLNVPSASTAISIVQTIALEWTEVARFSQRSSIHLTGRPSLRATAGITRSSG